MKIRNWLITFGFMVTLVCGVEVSAALYFFTGAVDDDFSNPANWEVGETAWKVPGDGVVATTVPGLSDSIFIGGKTGEHQVGQGNPKGSVPPDALTSTIYAEQYGGVDPAVIGRGLYQPEDGILDVYGAFSASSLILAQNGANNGNWVNGFMHVYDGGEVSISTTMTVGRYGWGKLDIFDGGTVLAGITAMGLNNGQGGEINLIGGLLQTGDLTILDPGGINDATWILRINQGELRISQDRTALVQEYIAAGKILFSGDLGPGWYFAYDYDLTNPGFTTVKAARDFLERIPYDQTTVSRLTSQLQWTLPDPNDSVAPSVVTCDVYFGTDPNYLFLPKIVNKQAVESASVTLELDQVYYWYMDVYDTDINGGMEPFYRSSVFTFNTSKVPPIVNAGGDAQTWLADAARIIQLEGSVSHFHSLPVTHEWTVLSEPDPLNPAVISNPDILNPTVTMAADGTYVLQLEATDGELTGTDTLQIIVYSDACEHASYQPGFAWRLQDINHDCTIDMLDLAEIAAQWSQWNYSLE